MLLTSSCFICMYNVHFIWKCLIYWTLLFCNLATAKAVVEETSKLADCIGKTRTLLRKILSEGVDHCMVKLDNDPQGYLSQPLSLLEAVLQECHNTFTACFHSFYPTPALQWACLCDLLNCLDQVHESVTSEHYNVACSCAQRSKAVLKFFIAFVCLSWFAIQILLWLKKLLHTAFSVCSLCFICEYMCGIFDTNNSSLINK